MLLGELNIIFVGGCAILYLISHAFIRSSSGWLSLYRLLPGTQLWDMARDQRARGVGGDGDGEGQEELIPASKAIAIVGMLMASHQLPAGR